MMIKAALSIQSQTDFLKRCFKKNQPPPGQKFPAYKINLFLAGFTTKGSFFMWVTTATTMLHNMSIKGRCSRRVFIVTNFVLGLLMIVFSSCCFGLFNDSFEIKTVFVGSSKRNTCT